MSMSPVLRALSASAALIVTASSAKAQDLFDTTVLRTVNLQFHDTNYWTLLQQNYTSQTNILADLTIDGVTYPSVGVRFRGNTSYTALPTGSQKASFNIDVDFVNPTQEVMGYSSLNFNNSFHDPTFCREVVYNNFVAQYMPNGRANHIVLTLNGQNWGVYANVQQFDKDLLREHFVDEDGLRIKCANNPQGPGLRYNGATQSGYTGYEIKDPGGFADPWAPLIATCNAVTNLPTADWPAIDAIFAIDQGAWSTALENLLTDDDSYVNKGADFVVYRDPVDGRTHLMQTDANESFTQTTWSPFLNFTATTKPVLSRVLTYPELRQRYVAHYRHAKQNLNWAYFEPIFTAHRTLIDAAVQADPKKLYTYALFTTNFTSSVTLPYSGPAGGTVPGLQSFVTGRLASLNANAEIAAVGPTISELATSEAFPDPTETVFVTARVAAATGAGVSRVDLYAKPTGGAYTRVQMFDNGLNGDGAAGDGVFGAVSPIASAAGKIVPFYVSAASTNTYSSQTYEPALAENGPLSFSYSFGQSGLRVTEYMYSGLSGEFIELTNTSSESIDLTGWSMDDDSAIAGTFSLTAGGILDPGESIVITDGDAAAFATAWGIPLSQVLGGNLAAGLGRNDAINLFDASGGLVDRLRFGDQTFAGTIRTQNASGSACRQEFGQDNIAAWVLATAGDAFGSHTSAAGDLGSPGVYGSVSCVACAADLTQNGIVDGADLGMLLSGWGSAGASDLNGNGTTDGADLGMMLSSWGDCP